jgi:hypothetical protein
MYGPKTRTYALGAWGWVIMIISTHIHSDHTSLALLLFPVLQLALSLQVNSFPFMPYSQTDPIYSSGFAVHAETWRWSFWEMLWLSGGSLIFLFFFLPEVSCPVL